MNADLVSFLMGFLIFITVVTFIALVLKNVSEAIESLGVFGPLVSIICGIVFLVMFFNIMQM